MALCHCVEGETVTLRNRSIGEVFPIMVEEENLNVVYNFEVTNLKLSIHETRSSYVV